MANFAIGQNVAAVGSVTMHAGGTRRLYLVGGGGNPKSPPAVTSKNPAIVSVSVPRLFDGKLGKWTIDIRALTKGDAELEGKVPDAANATLKVKVLDKLVLPDANTEQGMLVRLFLAEVRSPGGQGYSADDAKKCMQWMRLVLANRLVDKDPGRFMAKGAKTLVDIVKAPGQFKGFQNYPALDKDTADRIEDVVDIVNSDDDGRQASFAAYLELANAAATEKLSTDPSPPGSKLLGWRTQGSGSPGGSFVAFQGPILGNQFYTAK